MPYPRRGRARLAPPRPRRPLVLSGSKTLILSQATETDTAQTVAAQRRKPVGFPAASANTAQTVRPQKAVSIQQGQETDAAFGLTTGIIAVNKATETDTTTPIAAGHVIHVGQATAETDTSFAITRVHRKILGLATTTNTAQTVRRQKQVRMGGATTTNTAQAIRIGPTRVNKATEADTANPVLAIRSVAKRVNIGLATATTDVAFEMCPAGGRNIRRVTLTLFHE